MNPIIAWFARNGVAANILMVTMLACGILALFSIKREVMPSSESYMISVSVAYLGAAPEEVEEAVCMRIEESIQGLDGVKHVRSTAVEGQGAVTIELMLGADSRKVLDEVKARPLLVYCRSGNRSTVAAKLLIDAGFNDVINLRHGIVEWEREGLPIVD